MEDIGPFGYLGKYIFLLERGTLKLLPGQCNFVFKKSIHRSFFEQTSLSLQKSGDNPI